MAPATQAPATGGVRFAPSPTGFFHVGNLRTAWLAHRWAQFLGLPFVVRFEDIDRPRVVSGAQESQLEDLAALGLIADVVTVQSQFAKRHFALFVYGIQSDQIYPCDCSRKGVQDALATMASAPHDGRAPTYSGNCREKSKTRDLFAANTIAWRFRMPNDSGRDDFVVARSGFDRDPDGIPNFLDFTPAYHWACAVDDFDGRYELLVRSWDLAPAAAIQRSIQRWLAQVLSHQDAAVFHTALILKNNRERLEKRTRGVTLSELNRAGFSSDRLGELFNSSFTNQYSKDLSRFRGLAGEDRQSLTLEEIGVLTF